MIKVRTATPDDIALIHKLAHEAWPLAFKDILSAEQITYMLEMMYSSASLEQQFQNGHEYFLAKYGNDYAGYSSCEKHYHDSQTTKIHKLYTSPSFQRLGIGRTLIEHIAEMAKENNDEKLSLNVNKKNTAIAFYEKIGFTIILEETIAIGNGFFMDDYVMLKDL